MTSDDKVASEQTLAHLRSGIELVVTEKMDGGNVTFYRDGFHGRSLEDKTNPWDTAARALWASTRFDIPEGWRISGESMMAQRSVAYTDLPGVFMVFGIWDETNTLLSWAEMEQWVELLDVTVVPVLYRGTDFSEAVTAWERSYSPESSEGFVVRDAGRIHYDQFAERFAKYVRANHVRTSSDWRNRDDFARNGFTTGF